MRVLAGQKSREAERGDAGALAEHDGHGVADELAQPAGADMPGIARPHPLGMVALGELAQHGFDATARLHQPARPASIGIGLARWRRHERHAVGGKLGAERRAPVGTVAQRPAGLAGQQFGRERPVRRIGRRQRR